tara:strand:- start:42 stop:158 length:117 start_codon:yes stop_codon:yes gene_type:complete
VEALKDSVIAQQYRDIANSVLVELAAMDSDEGPEIVFE